MFWESSEEKHAYLGVVLPVLVGAGGHEHHLLALVLVLLL